MPRHADHDARRLQMAEAVCRLAARNGLEGVTLRQVAAEAGVSMGMVQHYFKTKDQILLFATGVMNTRTERRVTEAVAALEARGGLTARAGLRALLSAFVPADDDSRFDAPLRVAFFARAITEPALAVPLGEGITALDDYVASLLTDARRSGEIPGPIDPRQEAVSLLSLADGLMVRVLLDPAKADAALAALDYQLDRIFGEDAAGDAD